MLRRLPETKRASMGLGGTLVASGSGVYLYWRGECVRCKMQDARCTRWRDGVTAKDGPKPRRRSNTTPVSNGPDKDKDTDMTMAIRDHFPLIRQSRTRLDHRQFPKAHKHRVAAAVADFPNKAILRCVAQPFKVLFYFIYSSYVFLSFLLLSQAKPFCRSESPQKQRSIF